MPAAIPTRVPFGRTARRVEWSHLPPVVRREVEVRLGAAVVDAVSQGGGFKPGFASVLTDARGGRYVVKAASVRAQRPFAEACRQEARTLATLPERAPAPRLLWTTEVADWVVVCTQYARSRPPRRPWQRAELDACLKVLAEMAGTLTPPPAGSAADAAERELADWPALWDGVARPDSARSHLEQAAGLARRQAEVVAGRTLVHSDVRDDNLLLTADGRVLVCDWDGPMRGAAWLDSLLLLIGPRGDGLDVEAVMTSSPLLADVPSEDVDVVLALVAGYFLNRSAQPVPPSSPHLRAFQAWQGEVCWAWLAERRGWT